MKNFVPLAMDTYFRGNSAELEFCKNIGAGGNHVVAATASGKVLAKKRSLILRRRELAGVVAEFHRLPESDRRPNLSTPVDAKPPRRIAPKPPENGLVVRGYCTFLEANQSDKPVRSKVYYYKQNPDRWLVETQSDMLWLTEAERQSLVPKEPSVGDTFSVESAIQQRFFSTVGIDYMAGSVNSLPVRDSKMSITVERVDDDGVSLRLDGYGRMGEPLDEELKGADGGRGCELRLLGKLHCTKSGVFDQFDIVGVGKAWGNKTNYTRRKMSIQAYPWMYGIACELVTGNSAKDQIPPYNLLHYNSSGKPYFPKR